jgi:hypothetical protein
MLQLAKGIVESAAITKELDPQAILVHVEATGLSKAAREDLEVLAIDHNHRGYLCYDLVTGLVGPEHPLYFWLISNGASPDELSEITRKKIQLDVMGMNFYPQWSTREFFVTPKGRIANRAVAEDENGFSKLIEDYYRRYRTPIILTETSAFGSDETRSSWLEASTRAIKSLRAKGVPILGYTWFPMFTMIDWRYRHGKLQMKDYRIELGLFRLNDSNGGAPRWTATPLVSQMRRYIDNSREAVGELSVPGRTGLYPQRLEAAQNHGKAPHYAQ